MVRDPTPARFPPNIHPVRGDFEDHATLDAALEGVRGVYLSSSSGPDIVTHQHAVVEAAGRAGVRRIVKISALGADVPVNDNVVR